MVVVCGRILAQFSVVCLCDAGKIMGKGAKYKKSLPEREVIARPLGLHCNHFVSPSVRGQLVKMLKTLEPHGIF